MLTISAEIQCLVMKSLYFIHSVGACVSNLACEGFAA